MLTTIQTTRQLTPTEASRRGDQRRHRRQAAADHAPRTSQIKTISEPKPSPSQVFRISSLKELDQLKSKTNKPLLVTFYDSTQPKTISMGNRKNLTWSLEQIREIEHLSKLTNSIDYVICDIKNDPSLESFVLKTILKTFGQTSSDTKLLKSLGLPLNLVYDEAGQEVIPPDHDHAYTRYKIIDYLDPKRMTFHQPIPILVQKLEKGLGRKILSGTTRDAFFQEIEAHDRIRDKGRYPSQKFNLINA